MNCFENVFIVDKLEKIVYAGISRLRADLNCFRSIQDLTSASKTKNLKGKSLNKKWKYMINMASSEFPLKTNYELTRILNVYNGTNEVEIIKNINPRRVSSSWKLIKGKLEITNETKSEPPHGFRIVKGSAYCILSRSFVEYVLTSKKANDLLKWAEDTYSPDEW